MCSKHFKQERPITATMGMGQMVTTLTRPVKIVGQAAVALVSRLVAAERGKVLTKGSKQGLQ